jgi:NAD(P)-dependent dehydrogenase (short-subunit alcohol dehydrogenase family)
MSREPAGKARLAGQVAIVTGGSGGIGMAACIALALEGAQVVTVGRTAEKVDAVAGDVASAVPAAPRPLGMALDVRSEPDMEMMARRTQEAFGRIDILVTCAGLGRPSLSRSVPLPVAQLSPEAWDEMIDTNLTGVFLSNRAVLPAMMAQRRGQILNVSSSRGATEGQPYASAYCASKFGVMGLSEALAEEVRPVGIKVQVLLPDAVDTPLLHGTTLAPTADDALPASVVADFIVTMLTLPENAVLVNPLIAPFKGRRGSSRRRAARAAG